METLPKPATRNGPGRILLYAGFGFVVFWFTYLTFFGPKRPARLENSGMNEPAEYNWTLLDLDDQPVPFSKFKGKPIFLNFWATWCGPCVREMPSIDSLARDPRLQGKPIEFVCVSVDDDAQTIRQFLKGKDMRMTFLRIQDGKIPPVFGSQGIPMTFLIAADGRIVASELGAADWHEPEVVAFVEKMAGAGGG
jgi:thiol-disulfide isomerase/thioredoxin